MKYITSWLAKGYSLCPQKQIMNIFLTSNIHVIEDGEASPNLKRLIT
jgi:hypothetical protein